MLRNELYLSKVQRIFKKSPLILAKFFYLEAVKGRIDF